MSLATHVRTRPSRDAEPAPALHPSYAAGVVDAVKVHGRGENEVRALDGVTVGFEAGRFTAIMGPSGSGKSTLMHCAAGLDTLTSGQALIGDTDVTRLDEKRLTQLRRDRIGFIFQAFNLVPTLTAAENITLPIRLAGRKVDAGWFDHVVDTVGLGDRLHHRPSELSGGQQQRVAVARALVARPAIIFADEPTGNLDSRSGGEILAFLRTAVRELGQTIVMVTHDPVAAGYADRAVFLADGRVVDDIDRPTADSVLDPHPSPGGLMHDDSDARPSRSSLVARKLRLVSTAMAVVIGVAFMAGTFIFTDTLRVHLRQRPRRRRPGHRHHRPGALGDRRGLRRARPPHRRRGGRPGPPGAGRRRRRRADRRLRPAHRARRHGRRRPRAGAGLRAQLDHRRRAQPVRDRRGPCSGERRRDRRRPGQRPRGALPPG